MADDKEIQTVKLKTLEVEYGQVTLSIHPTMMALSKFCDLYIGIDENFQMITLNDVLAKHQEKFVKLKDKIYVDVFDKPIPTGPEPSEDCSKMSQEEKEKAKALDMEFGKRFAELSQKKITLEYPEITISKEALQRAMDREERKEGGILISPNDIAQLRDFINFI